MARKPADQSVSREDIITAAAEVLQRNGYESTTMKDIAAVVNLTAASLYHHFRNKDSLVLAVLEGGLDFTIDKLEPVVSSDWTPTQKLREMIRLHITYLTQNTTVGAAMVFEIRPLMNFKVPPRSANQFGNDDLQELVQRRDAFFAQRDYFEELFRRVVREGMASGEFREVDVPIFVKALLGAHNWVGVWYKAEGRLTGPEIAEQMADTFLRALSC